MSVRVRNIAVREHASIKQQHKEGVMPTRVIIILCSGLLWAFAAVGVQAEMVTFEVTAAVKNVYDPAGVLGGTIQAGDTITGTYTFDTATPDSNSLVIEISAFVHFY